MQDLVRNVLSRKQDVTTYIPGKGFSVESRLYGKQYGTMYI